MDDNHAEIRDGLRRVCASVQDLSAVGKGCPDLLVGYFGKNILMEIKDGDKPPSRQALTWKQSIWHAEWAGQVAIVRSLDEALAVCREVAGIK